jgi:hypothetical protein
MVPVKESLRLFERDTGPLKKRYFYHGGGSLLLYPDLGCYITARYLGRE